MAGIAILGVTVASAVAQVASSSDVPPNERITVYPPAYTIGRTPVPDAARHGFAVAESTSVSRPISYSDLDLSTSAGVQELQRRVTLTATDVCNELKKRFPSDLYPSVSQYPITRKYDCVQTAVDDAMNRIMADRRVAYASPTP
jgi:UrcA family protein